MLWICSRVDWSEPGIWQLYECWRVIQTGLCMCKVVQLKNDWIWFQDTSIEVFILSTLLNGCELNCGVRCFPEVNGYWRFWVNVFVYLWDGVCFCLWKHVCMWSMSEVPPKAERGENLWYSILIITIKHKVSFTCNRSFLLTALSGLPCFSFIDTTEVSGH